jgi:ABC-2 type transport system ATP-binding protein
VIILDEPTTGVDVEMRQSLWGFITELHQKGHTILLTTHYLEEVEALCDNIVMINKGSVLFKNSKDELLDRFHRYGIMVDVGVGADLSDDFKGQLQLKFASKLKSIETNLLKFEFLNNEDFIKSMNLIHELGVPIASINTRELSLEDVFIKILHR